MCGVALNWTNKDIPVVIDNNVLKLPLVNAAAQVIDGQHRLEGLKMAMMDNEAIGEKDMIVLLAENLSTQEAAKIFLNINTEQKPVPQSLVYDLFGEVKDRNSYIVRATDIAKQLHEDVDSPYYQCIKMPKSSQGMGKVDLSTIVNSLKEYMKPEGILEQYKLSDFNIQYRIIFNYFSAIKSFYNKEGCWLTSKNPFMSNAGFYAAVKFLHEDLLSKCIEDRSFEISKMINILKLDEIGLLTRNDIKNMQGKEQRSEIYKYLKNSILKDVPNQNEYRF